MLTSLPAVATSGRSVRSVRQAIIVALAALVTVVAIASFASSARADGVGLPYHASRLASCWVGSIQSRPPSDMRSWSGGMENVHWTSDQYRQNRYGNWYVYDGSKPRLHAAANSYGLRSITAGSIWLAPTNFGADNGLWYQNLPSGNYAVLQTYYWDYSGKSHTEWQSINSSGNSTCRF